MYHVGEGARPCSFPVTGNGHGRVTEPQGDHFSVRNLGMITKVRGFRHLKGIGILYRYAEVPSRVRSPLLGTDTDGLPSPRATNLVVVIWA